MLIVVPLAVASLQMEDYKSKRRYSLAAFFSIARVDNSSSSTLGSTPLTTSMEWMEKRANGMIIQQQDLIR